MIRFHRAFILATLLGLAGGFLFQRAVRDRPRVPEAPPTAQTLPVPAPLPATTALVGRLWTPAGAPAAGGAVIAGGPDWVRSTTLDAEGRFELGSLPAGEARFDLLLEGHRPRFERLTLPAPGPVEWVVGEPYAEVEGLPELARSDLEGRLDPPPAGGALGYEVWLRPSAAPDLAALAGVVGRRSAVDALGRFRFEGLAHGAYDVGLLPPFARGGDWPVLVNFSIDHRGAGEPLAVPSASSTLTGRLVDTEGAPVAGARVEVRSSRHPDRLWPVAHSDPDGEFRVPHLVDDSYRVEVHAGDARASLSLIVPRGYERRVELPPLDVRGDD